MDKSRFVDCSVFVRCDAASVVDSGENCRRKGARAGPGGKVDTPELSSGPICEIQEVSRVGAQGVTSNSKLLAREMPRVCSRGLRALLTAVGGVGAKGRVGLEPEADQALK